LARLLLHFLSRGSGLESLSQLLFGTTVDWDRKLLVVEAGPSFEIGTENRPKADLSFVSDSEDSCKSLLNRSIALPLHVAFLFSLFGKRLLCCIVNQMLFPMFDQ